MGRGEGDSPKQTIAFSPRRPGSARRVEVRVDEQMPAGKGKVAIPTQVYAENLPAAVAAELYRTNPDELRRLLVKQITGRDRGLLFNIAKRTFKIENAQISCDGCKQQFALADADFSGWTYDPELAHDFCASCSSGASGQQASGSIR